jgi:NTE family protein
VAEREGAGRAPTSSAVVLGGGGPVGIAWESGLAVGLADRGIDLGRADRTIGTSAGSVVGAQLVLGRDLAAGVERLHRRGRDAPADGPGGAARSASMGSRLARLMEVMAEAAAWEGPPEEGRAALGRFAREAETMPEDDFLALFADLADERWPAGFACTAVDASTGAFVVWDEGSGVDLQRAVASSCSVPGVYPPVTMGGGRYIDGGMRSGLNADVAAGHDRVVVVSVMPLSLPGVTDPRFLRLQRQYEEELDRLRGSAADVAVVGPGEELLAISGMGMFLMDSSRAPGAYDAGLRQAEHEADRLAATWAG